MIHPCILSGGSGSRLWPLSRKAYPKQFLKIFDGESLFQKTCQRVTDTARFAPPLVIANQDHRFLVGEQLADQELSADRIILEPMGRNTAAPAAIAALAVEQNDPDGLILLLPSDHLIGDEAAFAKAIAAGVPAALSGSIVTFGIRPSEPNTGYGYIHLDGESASGGARDVRAFVEKPDRAKAETYLADGNFVWNAGIFLFSAKAMRAAFEAHAPEILSGAACALKGANADLDFLRLDEEAFGGIENISFDYAIMERAKNIACVPMDPGWSDLGSWTAIRDAFPKDESGNSALGEARFMESRNSFVYTDQACVSLLGLDDVLVVNTRDALLVAHKDKAQDVKKIVEALEAENRIEVVEHKRVYRPWGWYEGLSAGERFQVKCIMVKPGAQLSLQSHVHRAEHWVVVSGTAKVTIDGKVALLGVNQSTYIPLAAVHRLANPGKIPTYLIEVQSGSYLGEDDIVRYEDVYGRDKT